MNSQNNLRPLESNPSILNPIIIQNIFSPDECNDVIQKSKGKGFYKARLENSVVNSDIRETNIKFLDLNDENVWIAKKIVPVITSINSSIFKFKEKPNQTYLLMKQGSIVIFPSFVTHKVSPVTEGIRYSLVGWVHGPPFQ